MRLPRGELEVSRRMVTRGSPLPANLGGDFDVFFFSLMPATFLVTLGFFVVFAAAKAEDGIRTFGRVLAIWIFIVALVPPSAGAYVTISGLCPIESVLQKAQGG